MEKLLTRRSFVEAAVVVPSLAMLLASRAAADEKASQASMHYQGSPNGDKQCSKCQFFLANQDAQANGTCRIVDGAISPHGYCMAFAPK
jgi:High potential iron-sulfur protein